MPRWAAIAAGTCASRSYGKKRSPQELNRKCTSASRPCGSRTKIGPLSRIQESSMGTGRISMPPPQWSRASPAWAGPATMITGSNAAIARATVAYSRLASASSSPHSSALVWVGHSIRHPWWGAHSAGMANPSSRGVVIVSSVAHELDLLHLAGSPAHRGARRDVQPEPPGRLAVELQPRVGPPERVVRRDPDRPRRSVTHRQPLPLPSLVQHDRFGRGTDLTRRVRLRLPRLTQHHEPAALV